MKTSPRGPRVVIIGGGFGGLHAAKALTNEAVKVTLIDRKNHHIFQPLLYQVALGVLSAGEITASLRHILRKSDNVYNILGEVIRLRHHRATSEITRRRGNRLRLSDHRGRGASRVLWP